MKLLIINGPNMNLLGLREPDIYGKRTYSDLIAMIDEHCKALGIEAEFFQSNHEGAIIDKIQESYGVFDGLVINPAGYTHTSVAIADAISAVAIPTIEVHISDISAREDFRHRSITGTAALEIIYGKGFDGYCEAVTKLYDKIKASL